MTQCPSRIRTHHARHLAGTSELEPATAGRDPSVGGSSYHTFVRVLASDAPTPFISGVPLSMELAFKYSLTGSSSTSAAVVTGADAESWMLCKAAKDTERQRLRQHLEHTLSSGKTLF